MNKIIYQTVHKREEFEVLLEGLNDTFGSALLALELLQNCGSAEIADDEEYYVEEMQTFIASVKMAEDIEFAEAIESIERARREIYLAAEKGSVNIDHPWFRDATEESSRGKCVASVGERQSTEISPSESHGLEDF